LERSSEGSRAVTYETPVDELEEIDRKAFTDSKAFIKPELLINSLYELHVLFADYYGRLLGKLCSNQREALSECIQAIRKEFVFGCITSLRAHTTDGESYRRKAVEFCAFGILILRSPQNAKIWLEALNSKRKYSQYKSRYKPMSVLKEVSDTGIKLALLYEELCKEVHASPYAIKTQSRIFVVKDGRRINYLNYHDDWTVDGQYALAQSFVTGMEMDFFLLVTFAGAMAMQFPDLDMSEWVTKRDSVLAILETEKKRIKLLKSSKD
jgi:hypothetical protein